MSEVFEEKTEQRLDFEYFRSVIGRRLWYFLIPLFLGWLTVWSVSWLLPSIYRSGTLILIEQPSVPSQYVMSNITDNLQDRLQSISQQILSRTRLLHIIEASNLYPQERQRISPDEVVERMRKDIEIELVRSPGSDQLSAFNVYYSSRDPRVAQQVTSELTNLFIAENLAVRQEQSENTTKFLQNELEEARRTLSEQEEKIREFKDQHLGDLPGQLQSNLQILSGLQNQLGAEQEALNRAKQQNVYLESLLGQYRVQRSATGGENTVVGLPALEQELNRLKAQLADLSSHYTDRHPDVRKLKEQIAKTERMKEQLKADLKAKSSDLNVSPESAPRDAAEIAELSPSLELQSQLKVNRIEIGNRERAIPKLEGQIADYQARLNRVPVREQQLADLTRNYDQSRLNYDSLLKKKNDSELATSLELRQQGEHFRILDPSSLPVKPFSPNRMKLGLIGLFVGVVLGGAMAAGAEFLDNHIYAEAELKKLLPVAVISEIPNIATQAEDNANRTKMLLGWGFTALEFATILVGFAITYFHG